METISNKDFEMTAVEEKNCQPKNCQPAGVSLVRVSSIAEALGEQMGCGAWDSTPMHSTPMHSTASKSTATAQHWGDGSSFGTVSDEQRSETLPPVLPSREDSADGESSAVGAQVVADDFVAWFSRCHTEVPGGDENINENTDENRGEDNERGSSETFSPHSGDSSCQSEEAESAARLEKCRALASSPNLLKRVVAQVEEMGVVCDGPQVALTYLVLTSRVTNHPANLLIKGSSSAGKSYPTEKLIELFPDNAVVRVSETSPKALFYIAESLRHKILFLDEATGINKKFEETLRKLLSEGYIIDRSSVASSEGRRGYSKRQEGPCGFLSTTTMHHMNAENETRMLSLTILDSPERTAAILAAKGRQRAGGHKRVDNSEFVALQEWLEVANHRVAIPFASVLGRLMPSTNPRAPRDFDNLIALLEASAILHQVNRPIDGTGAVVASLDDYRIVHGCVADVMAYEAGTCVPAGTREVVGWVEQALALGKSPLSVRGLATFAGRDASTISRRLVPVFEEGYLVKRHPRNNTNFDIHIGLPLPEDRPAIPAPDILEREWKKEGGA